jgi:hypothetical protein
VAVGVPAPPVLPVVPVVPAVPVGPGDAFEMAGDAGRWLVGDEGPAVPETVAEGAAELGAALPPPRVTVHPVTINTTTKQTANAA